MSAAEEAVARVLALCDQEEARVDALNKRLLAERGKPDGLYGRKNWVYGTIVSTEEIRQAVAEPPKRGERFRHKVIQRGLVPRRGLTRSLCGKVWHPVAWGSAATRFDACPECYEIAASTRGERLRVVA